MTHNAQESAKLARRAAEAVFRRPKPDFETVNMLFAPEHEFVSLISEIEGRSWRGASGFRDFLTAFGDSVDFEGLVESATELDGHRVLLEVTITTRGKSSDVGLSDRRWWVMTVREGKVVRTASYSTHEDALRAVGPDD